MPKFYLFAIFALIYNTFHVESSSPSTMEPNVQPWDYIDMNDGTKLQGFYSVPTKGEGPFPAVIILP